ncbi:peroxidase family protein [Ophiocordyceps camponoti-floridani]|uniref:Peroxidase family protein n=1 Tax=Ophiocordyceps camponoti-floridani TaxID=2030778 RepID=A0A8H4Q8U4_9HYPO|nr:peroxidase family protein [Ophiocordyceps camponoti-floridani]
MAKIHTVEWTPAILVHPTLQTGMRINWWGAVGEKLNGIVSRPTKGLDHQAHSGLRFVSVYRMHPLIPDTIALFDSSTGTHHSTLPTKDVLFTQAHSPFRSGLTLSDAFYSLGINYAGAITTNNYPDFLRSLRTPDGQFRDLATFRRLLGMSAPATFAELTGGNGTLARELEEVYGDIELVDVLVGSHSEPLIPGFGFGDTAFRIFVVMASNRLKSDRFFAQAWNEETYTAEGLAWVQRTGMKDVLLRHCPDLHRVLRHCDNVFAPWAKLPRSRA